MPKNKFQDVVFTAIMATIMVYGMVVYNVALNTGDVSGTTFVAALHELPIMVPIAFILEFFVVGKIARGLAFSVMTPQDRPQFITYAIHLHLLYHVSDHESDRNLPVQGAKFWYLDQDMGNELPDGDLLADVLLRTIGASDLPSDLRAQAG